jgi:Ser/Thr protein kinase RdoA (MazF antagonist)
VYSRQGAIKVDSLPVVYSTPSTAAVVDFVLMHYDLPKSIECKLLNRGWNDIFEVGIKGGERFIFRLSKRRLRGDADLRTETAFLAYLDRTGIPVAAAIPMRDGSLFASGRFPEGERPAVLFRYAEGRPSQAGTSLSDARANGVTLARIHEVASGFAAAKTGRYKLDCDHLLHRPLTAILADEDLSDPIRAGFADLSERLSNRLAEREGLLWTHCHGDCNGRNANIAMQGPRAGQAVFFDFDESGTGYLAYDLAVFLFVCVRYDPKDHAPSWRAFIEGYRSIRQLSSADFEAAHLFVPFVGIWFAGEYASRIHEWGRQAVPPNWFAEHLDFMLSWENEKLVPGLL